MNKKELVARLASGCDLRKSTVSDVLDFIGATAMVELSSGRDIVIPHVGRLHVESRGGRRGRNPRTGAPIDIPARKVLRLTVAGEMKKAIA